MQLPASVTSNMTDRFEDLLDHVSRYKNTWQLAVEFREKGWYTDRVYRLLEEAKACLVEQDMPKSATPSNVPDSGVRYFRFHGEAGDYRGGYSDAFLQALSLKIRKATAAGAIVYCYFNNTLGEAVHNAISLGVKTTATSYL